MHEEICTEHGGSNVVVVKKIDINELMAGSDLTITSWSTTGLESLIMGTPLLTLNLTGREEKMPYVASGAAFGAESVEEMPGALKEALAPISPEMAEKQKSYVYDYAYEVDGKASQRVVEAIEELF